MISRLTPIILTLAAVTAAVCPSCGSKSSDSGKEEAPAVDVARAATDSVTLYRRIPGILHAADKVDLVARVSGYLRSINYNSGDVVKKGQLLFTIEDTRYRDAVAQAGSQLQSAKSSYEYARSHYEAMLKALKSDAVSQMEVKQAKSAMEQAQAEINNARAALQTASTQLGYCRIYAPFTGRITASSASVGAFLNGEAAPQTLATIYEDSHIQAYFTIEDAAFLRSFTNNPNREKVNYDSIPLAFSEKLPHRYTGKLHYLAPEIDPETGQMQLRADIENPFGELRDGMYVTVDLPTGTDPAAVVVKDKALSTDQLGKYLYTVNDSNKIVYTHVETGQLANDSMRIITSGLKAGTPYVTKALLKVRPGVEIRPVYRP